MSHPSTWPSIAITALPDGGLVTFVDTDGVTKTTPMTDFKKRLLSTGSIAWMTGGLTSVDSMTSGDFLFVWDASAVKIVTLTRDALLNFLLGTEDVSWMTPLATAAVDRANDKILMIDDSASGKKLVTVLAGDILTSAGPYHTTTIDLSSSPRTIAETEAGYSFTNYGAPATRVCNLPPGAANLRYRFEHVAAFNIEIDPDGSQAILGGGNGKKLVMSADGAVVIEWHTGMGKWRVVGGSGIYQFEV